MSFTCSYCHVTRARNEFCAEVSSTLGAQLILCMQCQNSFNQVDDKKEESAFQADKHIIGTLLKLRQQNMLRVFTGLYEQKDSGFRSAAFSGLTKLFTNEELDSFIKKLKLEGKLREAMQKKKASPSDSKKVEKKLLAITKQKRDKKTVRGRIASKLKL